MEPPESDVHAGEAIGSVSYGKPNAVSGETKMIESEHRRSSTEPTKENGDENSGHLHLGAEPLDTPWSNESQVEHLSLSDHNQVWKTKSAEINSGGGHGANTDASTAVHCDGTVEKPVGQANGCWLGANINGENGFTKLDHVRRTSWLDEAEIEPPTRSQSEQVLDPAVPTAQVPLKEDGEAKNVPTPRDGRGSSEALAQQLGELNLTTRLEGSSDFTQRQQWESGTEAAGPCSYSHVDVVPEQASPVVVVSCGPPVHVASAVVTNDPTHPVRPLAAANFGPPANEDRPSFCELIADTAGGLGEIGYVAYASELQMPDIMRLIQKDLSEPYSIYTYRYFIHNWPKLCFLAMDEDKCVGSIVCKLDLHKKVVRRGYIAMLAVDENYRKRKIGSNLVLKAIQAMVEDDADEVVLETEISNKPALRLYENLGFVRDKRLFRYYLNGVDALRLKLWLR